MTPIQLSCAFATELDTPAHIAVAEDLGYHRAWCYDSPAVLSDVWMILALAAGRTGRIGLGPGVLIPSLRHPMVTAAAVTTLAANAPGRVAVGVGSGFSARLSMGQKPVRWNEIGQYIETIQSLLAGQTVLWQGQPIAMLHPRRCASDRPSKVPIFVGADGPRGLAVAAQFGDGLFSANDALLAADDHDQRVLLMWGTVLKPGENPRSNRVRQTLRPGTAVLYHVTYQRGGADAVDQLPGGRQWRTALESRPEPYRHLAVHAGHQIELNELDHLLFPAADGSIPKAAFIGTPEELREKVAVWAEAGITEIAFQPAGPDICGALERFAAATGGQ